MWLGIILIVLAVAAGGAPPAFAETCPPPPPPVRDLALPRFYADAEGSVIDPEALAAQRAAVEPLTQFLRRVVADVDRSLRSANGAAAGEAASCALSWIEAWARGDAWLGTMNTQQSEYQRKWDLAGVALAYLKVRRFATTTQRQAIEPWLVRFADRARAFFDDARRKRNNHWYWLGLGMAAVGLASDSDRHWQTARAIYADAMRDIRADGSLPLELERKSRALQYHAFSLTPLIVMAELGALKGEDWHAEGDGALHRLAAFTARGLADPTRVSALAGAPQSVPVSPAYGWRVLYESRFPGRLQALLPDVPTAHRWLGGDVRLLGAALARSR